MTAFADTSAMYAAIDISDERNQRAVRGWRLIRTEPIVTHGYVIAETLALVRRRLGVDVALRMIDDFIPTLHVRAVDEEVFARALGDYRAARTGGASFVDRVSFAFMRRHGLTRAWALDRDFTTAGFELVA